MSSKSIVRKRKTKEVRPLLEQLAPAAWGPVSFSTSKVRALEQGNSYAELQKKAKKMGIESRVSKQALAIMIYKKKNIFFPSETHYTHRFLIHMIRDLKVKDLSDQEAEDLTVSEARGLLMTYYKGGGTVEGNHTLANLLELHETTLALEDKFCSEKVKQVVRQGHRGKPSLHDMVEQSMSNALTAFENWTTTNDTSPEEKRNMLYKMLNQKERAEKIVNRYLRVIYDHCQDTIPPSCHPDLMPRAIINWMKTAYMDRKTILCNVKVMGRMVIFKEGEKFVGSYVIDKAVQSVGPRGEKIMWIGIGIPIARPVDKDDISEQEYDPPFWGGGGAGGGGNARPTYYKPYFAQPTYMSHFQHTTLLKPSEASHESLSPTRVSIRIPQAVLQTVQLTNQQKQKIPIVNRPTYVNSDTSPQATGWNYERQKRRDKFKEGLIDVATRLSNLSTPIGDSILQTILFGAFSGSLSPEAEPILNEPQVEIFETKNPNPEPAGSDKNTASNDDPVTFNDQKVSEQVQNSSPGNDHEIVQVKLPYTGSKALVDPYPKPWTSVAAPYEKPHIPTEYVDLDDLEKEKRLKDEASKEKVNHAQDRFKVEQERIRQAELKDEQKRRELEIQQEKEPLEESKVQRKRFLQKQRLKEAQERFRQAKSKVEQQGRVERDLQQRKVSGRSSEEAMVQASLLDAQQRANLDQERLRRSQIEAEQAKRELDSKLELADRKEAFQERLKREQESLREDQLRAEKSQRELEILKQRHSGTMSEEEAYRQQRFLLLQAQRESYERLRQAQVESEQAQKVLQALSEEKMYQQKRFRMVQVLKEAQVRKRQAQLEAEQNRLELQMAQLNQKSGISEASQYQSENLRLAQEARQRLKVERNRTEQAQKEADQLKRELDLQKQVERQKQATPLEEDVYNAQRFKLLQARKDAQERLRQEKDLLRQAEIEAEQAQKVVSLEKMTKEDVYQTERFRLKQIQKDAQERALKAQQQEEQLRQMLLENNAKDEQVYQKQRLQLSLQQKEAAQRFRQAQMEAEQAKIALDKQKKTGTGPGESIYQTRQYEMILVRKEAQKQLLRAQMEADQTRRALEVEQSLQRRPIIEASLYDQERLSIAQRQAEISARDLKQAEHLEAQSQMVDTSEVQVDVVSTQGPSKNVSESVISDRNKDVLYEGLEVQWRQGEKVGGVNLGTGLVPYFSDFMERWLQHHAKSPARYEMVTQVPSPGYTSNNFDLLNWLSPLGEPIVVNIRVLMPVDPSNLQQIFLDQARLMWFVKQYHQLQEDSRLGMVKGVLDESLQRSNDLGSYTGRCLVNVSSIVEEMNRQPEDDISNVWSKALVEYGTVFEPCVTDTKQIDIRPGYSPVPSSMLMSVQAFLQMQHRLWLFWKSLKQPESEQLIKIGTSVAKTIVENNGQGSKYAPLIQDQDGKVTVGVDLMNIRALYLKLIESLKQNLEVDKRREGASLAAELLAGSVTQVTFGPQVKQTVTISHPVTNDNTRFFERLFSPLFDGTLSTLEGFFNQLQHFLPEQTYMIRSLRFQYKYFQMMADHIRNGAVNAPFLHLTYDSGIFLNYLVTLKGLLQQHRPAAAQRLFMQFQALQKVFGKIDQKMSILRQGDQIFNVVTKMGHTNYFKWFSHLIKFPNREAYGDQFLQLKGAIEKWLGVTPDHKIQHSLNAFYLAGFIMKNLPPRHVMDRLSQDSTEHPHILPDVYSAYKHLFQTFKENGEFVDFLKQFAEPVAYWKALTDSTLIEPIHVTEPRSKPAFGIFEGDVGRMMGHLRSAIDKDELNRNTQTAIYNAGNLNMLDEDLVANLKQNNEYCYNFPDGAVPEPPSQEQGGATKVLVPYFEKTLEKIEEAQQVFTTTFKGENLDPNLRRYVSGAMMALHELKKAYTVLKRVRDNNGHLTQIIKEDEEKGLEGLDTQIVLADSGSLSKELAQFNPRPSSEKVEPWSSQGALRLFWEAWISGRHPVVESTALWPTILLNAQGLYAMQEFPEVRYMIEALKKVAPSKGTGQVLVTSGSKTIDKMTRRFGVIPVFSRPIMYGPDNLIGPRNMNVRPDYEAARLYAEKVDVEGTPMKPAPVVIYTGLLTDILSASPESNEAFQTSVERINQLLFNNMDVLPTPELKRISQELSNALVMVKETFFAVDGLEATPVQTTTRILPNVKRMQEITDSLSQAYEGSYRKNEMVDAEELSGKLLQLSQFLSLWNKRLTSGNNVIVDIPGLPYIQSIHSTYPAFKRFLQNTGLQFNQKVRFSIHDRRVQATTALLQQLARAYQDNLVEFETYQGVGNDGNIGLSVSFSEMLQYSTWPGIQGMAGAALNMARKHVFGPGGDFISYVLEGAKQTVADSKTGIEQGAVKFLDLAGRAAQASLDKAQGKAKDAVVWRSNLNKQAADTLISGSQASWEKTGQTLHAAQKATWEGLQWASQKGEVFQQGVLQTKQNIQDTSQQVLQVGQAVSQTWAQATEAGKELNKLKAQGLINAYRGAKQVGSLVKQGANVGPQLAALALETTEPRTALNRVMSKYLLWSAKTSAKLLKDLYQVTQGASWKTLLSLHTSLSVLMDVEVKENDSLVLPVTEGISQQRWNQLRLRGINVTPLYTEQVALLELSGEADDGTLYENMQSQVGDLYGPEYIPQPRNTSSVLQNFQPNKEANYKLGITSKKQNRQHDKLVHTVKEDMQQARQTGQTMADYEAALEQSLHDLKEVVSKYKRMVGHSATQGLITVASLLSRNRLRRYTVMTTLQGMAELSVMIPYSDLVNTAAGYLSAFSHSLTPAMSEMEQMNSAVSFDMDDIQKKVYDGSVSDTAGKAVQQQISEALMRYQDATAKWLKTTMKQKNILERIVVDLSKFVKKSTQEERLSQKVKQSTELRETQEILHLDQGLEEDMHNLGITSGGKWAGLEVGGSSQISVPSWHKNLIVTESDVCPVRGQPTGTIPPEKQGFATIDMPDGFSTGQLTLNNKNTCPTGLGQIEPLPEKMRSQEKAIDSRYNLPVSAMGDKQQQHKKPVPFGGPSRRQQYQASKIAWEDVRTYQMIQDFLGYTAKEVYSPKSNHWMNSVMTRFAEGLLSDYREKILFEFFEATGDVNLFTRISMISSVLDYYRFFESGMTGKTTGLVLTPPADMMYDPKVLTTRFHPEVGQTFVDTPSDWSTYPKGREVFSYYMRGLSTLGQGNLVAQADPATGTLHARFVPGDFLGTTFERLHASLQGVLTPKQQEDHFKQVLQRPFREIPYVTQRTGKSLTADDYLRFLLRVALTARGLGIPLSQSRTILQQQHLESSYASLLETHQISDMINQAYGKTQDSMTREIMKMPLRLYPQNRDLITMQNVMNSPDLLELVRIVQESDQPSEAFSDGFKSWLAMRYPDYLAPVEKFLNRLSYTTLTPLQIATKIIGMMGRGEIEAWSKTVQLPEARPTNNGKLSALSEENLKPLPRPVLPTSDVVNTIPSQVQVPLISSETVERAGRSSLFWAQFVASLRKSNTSPLYGQSSAVPVKSYVPFIHTVMTAISTLNGNVKDNVNPSNIIKTLYDTVSFATIVAQQSGLQEKVTGNLETVKDNPALVLLKTLNVDYTHHPMDDIIQINPSDPTDLDGTELQKMENVKNQVSSTTPDLWDQPTKDKMNRFYQLHATILSQVNHLQQRYSKEMAQCSADLSAHFLVHGDMSAAANMHSHQATQAIAHDQEMIKRRAENPDLDAVLKEREELRAAGQFEEAAVKRNQKMFKTLVDPIVKDLQDSRAEMESMNSRWKQYHENGFRGTATLTEMMSAVVDLNRHPITEFMWEEFGEPARKWVAEQSWAQEIEKRLNKMNLMGTFGKEAGKLAFRLVFDQAVTLDLETFTSQMAQVFGLKNEVFGNMVSAPLKTQLVNLQAKFDAKNIAATLGNKNFYQFATEELGLSSDQLVQIADGSLNGPAVKIVEKLAEKGHISQGAAMLFVSHVKSGHTIKQMQEVTHTILSTIQRNNNFLMSVWGQQHVKNMVQGVDSVTRKAVSSLQYGISGMGELTDLLFTKSTTEQALQTILQNRDTILSELKLKNQLAHDQVSVLLNEISSSGLKLLQNQPVNLPSIISTTAQGATNFQETAVAFFHLTDLARQSQSLTNQDQTGLREIVQEVAAGSRQNLNTGMFSGIKAAVGGWF